MSSDRKSALGVDGVDDGVEVLGWIDRFFEIDAEEVGGRFGAEPVFIKFQAGQEEHAVFFARPFPFFFEDLKVFGRLCKGQDHAGEVTNLAEEPFVARDVVGDGENVELALAVEIDEVADGEFAIGESGVGMEVGEEELFFVGRWGGDGAPIGLRLEVNEAGGRNI